MKILLLTDTGFLADPLLAQLAATPDVAVTTLPAETLATPAAQSQVQALHPDVVIHLHVRTAAEAALALETFTDHAGCFVVAATQEIYAAFAALHRQEERTPSSLPLSESAPLRAHDPAGIEPLFLDQHRLPITLLRLPLLYGPGDPHHTFFPFIKRMDDGRPALLLDPAFGNFRRSHAYVENAAHALTLAALHPHTDTRLYNLGEGPFAKTPTVGERLHDLARAARYRGQIVVIPHNAVPPHLLQNLDFRHDLIADDTPLRKERHYTEIVDTPEAFRRTLAWERLHPPATLDPHAFNYAAEDEVLRKFGLLRPTKKT